MLDLREKEMLLRELRSKLVGELHTQPFTIYSDATIKDLLKAQPKTLQELSKVRGFPPEGKRFRGFGEAVVKIFTEDVKAVEVTATGVTVQIKEMGLF